MKGYAAYPSISKPIGRFHDAATLTVTNDTRRLPELRLRILPFLRIQFLSVCIVGFPLVVHEKGEGEIKFFMDGDKKFPTICGTGTEDYFCGSYNF